MRINTPHSVAVLPAPAGVGPANYFQDTDPAGSTELSADWCQFAQEARCRTIEHANLVVSQADLDQFTAVVGGADGISTPAGAAVDTGLVTTLHKQAVVACTTSRSDGDDSLVAASKSGRASGAESAVLATDSGTASGPQSAVLASGFLAANSPLASGARSFIAASTGDVEASGDESAVIATTGTSTAVGDGSAVIACVSSFAGLLPANVSSVAMASTGVDAGGLRALVAASGGASTALGTEVAVLASTGGTAPGTNCALLATAGAAAGGTTSALIGCDTAATTLGDKCVAVGCSDGTLNGTSNTALASHLPTAGVGVVRSGLLATIGSGIAKADAADAPANNAIIACDTAGVTGDHANCAVIASDMGRVERCVGGVAGNTDIQCAVIGCNSGIISTTLAGGGSISQVLVASLNAEMCNSGGVARNYCVAGGYWVGAPIASVGAMQNLSWRIESNGGNIFLAGNITVLGGGAGPDFAEMFENASAGAIPSGTLLARAGKKVRAALPGDRVLGVVSAAPAIIAGDSTDQWPGRRLHDEWGAEIKHIDAKGQWSAVESEDYDPSKSYVSRRSRPDEWTVVGLLGQIRTRVDATVQADSFVVPGPNGLGMHSDEPGKGRPIECMEIVVPFDPERGHAVALCLVG